MKVQLTSTVCSIKASGTAMVSGPRYPKDADAVPAARAYNRDRNSFINLRETGQKD